MILSFYVVRRRLSFSLLAVKRLQLTRFPFLDDSGSMRSNPGRVEALKDTLRRTAQVATSLTEDGISVRFLNYAHDNNGDYDNMDDVNQIMRKVNNAYQHKLSGTRLGTMLNSKVVLSMVGSKIQRRAFQKPLITVIITDGEVGLARPPLEKKNCAS